MSKAKKIKTSELLLILLFADNCKPIRGNTRFQKLIFIFEKEILKQYSFNKLGENQSLLDFSFEAYKFGPYSKEFYKHRDFFVAFGMINQTKISIDNDFYLESSSNEIDNVNYWEYKLSKKGEEYVRQKLWNILNDRQRSILDSLKEQFVNKNLKEILNYVYSKYPEMTVKSEILEDILNSEGK